MMKKKKECFTIKYYDMEFVLPKSSISFKNGYGCVKAYLATFDGIIDLKGIVNKEFETVLDLSLKSAIPKIDFFPQDKALAVMFDGRKYNTFLCQISDRFNIIEDAGAVDYKVVDDTKVMLAFLENKRYIFRLYDVCKGEFLGNYFHTFGEFSYNDEIGMLVTWVSLIINDETNRSLMWVMSQDGEVLSPFVDSETKEIYNSNMSISEIINIIKGR